MTARERMVKIFVELFEVDNENSIVDNVTIDDYLDGTDFDIIDLNEALEIEFDITVYDGDFTTTITFGELVQYVETKLEEGK